MKTKTAVDRCSSGCLEEHEVEIECGEGCWREDDGLVVVEKEYWASMGAVEQQRPSAFVCEKRMSVMQLDGASSPQEWQMVTKLKRSGKLQSQLCRDLTRVVSCSCSCPAA